ncbi:hypothetical protein [Bacillus nitratireducens]|nr:hypothetical protein [Bacillus nitratireducens]
MKKNKAEMERINHRLNLMIRIGEESLKRDLLVSQHIRNTNKEAN